MADKTYAITRAEISLHSGVKVIADVGSLDDVKKLLADIKAVGLGEPSTDEPVPSIGDKKPKAPVLVPETGDDPTRRIETQVGLEAGRLSTAKILAIKDGIPQFLQKTLFASVTDAVLVLMFSLEAGLKQNPVPYDDFVALFDSQNLKSGSPLSMLITNLRNASYLDNRAYADGRKLRLTAKGEAKAIEVIKKLATRSGA